MATVVSSVPDASRAAPSPSRLGAPPVPMMRREPSPTPSMTSLSLSCGWLRVLMLVVSVMVSASLDCGDQFDVVTIGERCDEPLAAGYYFGVVGDGDAQFLPVGGPAVGAEGTAGDLA